MVFFFFFLLHVFFFLFKVFIIVFIGSSFLVLLILRDEIIHVGLCFCEFHFVHSFPGVPVEESLSPEHGRELFANSLEDLLDGGGVADKGGCHLETSGGNVTNTGHHVVGDPFSKVGAVLVLDVHHLLVNLLHGHSASEAGSHSQVPSVSRITSCHHILGVKHLLSELRYCDSSVLLGASGCQGGEAGHEEVQPGEGNHVDSQLCDVSIELSREPETGGDT